MYRAELVHLRHLLSMLAAFACSGAYDQDITLVITGASRAAKLVALPSGNGSSANRIGVMRGTAPAHSVSIPAGSRTRTGGRPRAPA